MGIAVGAIRATVNRSTGFTPNGMMLGREVMMPLDLMSGSVGEEVGDIIHLYCRCGCRGSQLLQPNI